MITSPRYPYLEIWVRVRSYEEVVLAYIDTGFDGYVILPSRYAKRLGACDYVSRWELGDGSLALAEEYLGAARVVGLAKETPVRITCLGTEYLVGRRIIDQFRLIFDHGQAVHIEL